MRIVHIIICGVIAIGLTAFGQPPSPTMSSPSTDELVGLWKAKRRFGPDARGSLIIQRTGSTYTADMVGRLVPILIDKGDLTFELPDGQGTFRGKFDSKDSGIRGHWIRPGSPVDSGEYASPVHLKPDGHNRWRGIVSTIEDDFTFYLLAEKQPDGSVRAVLRNLERDYGSQIGVERLTRDGNIVKLIGKRPGQKDDRDLAKGSFDPDNQVISLMFPSRGGSYDFRRDGDNSDFYPRGKNPGPYLYTQPPATDDGWQTGTLEEANIDRTGIETLVQMMVDTPETGDTPQIHAILIARHGKLVLEEYFHGQNRDKLHTTRSASKSVTSVVVGAAMQAGAPLKASTPVYQLMNRGKFPPGLEPEKQTMTLENLLTMSSGYFCDDFNSEAPGNEPAMLDQTEEPDYYRFYMKVKLDRRPGEKAVYCSGDPNLALGMVGQATGEDPLYSFDRLIGGPMKINRYGWPLDPARQPYGGGSTQFLARDFMKFGQLMLNGGTWEGRRILSTAFVARASAPLYDLQSRKYGYLWWGVDYPYKDRKVYSFSALGTGGQLVTVIPELDLVIMAYGGNYASRGGRRVQNEIIPQNILPAVKQALKKKARR